MGEEILEDSYIMFCYNVLLYNGLEVKVVVFFVGWKIEEGMG